MALFHDFDTIARPVKSTMNWNAQAQNDNDNRVIASALRKDALNAIKRAKNAKWKQIAEDKVALHNQFVKTHSTYVSIGTTITW